MVDRCVVALELSFGKMLFNPSSTVSETYKDASKLFWQLVSFYLSHGTCSVFRVHRLCRYIEMQPVYSETHVYLTDVVCKSVSKLDFCYRKQ